VAAAAGGERRAARPLGQSNWREAERDGEVDPEHPNNYNKRGLRSKDRRYSKLGISEKYITHGQLRKMARKAGVKRMQYTTHFDMCEVIDKLVDNIVMNANILRSGRTAKIKARDLVFICKNLHSFTAGNGQTLNPFD